MAKLTKKSIAAARKKVPASQWQKRGLKTAWAIQKRGGGKRKPAAKKAPARKIAAPKKAPAKRRTSVAKKGNPNNKSPKIGASIQAFKGAQPLLSPVIDSAATAADAAGFVEGLRKNANLNYAGNVAATAINQAFDRKLAHGGALSRGSITAWAAEAFAGFQASTEVVEGQTGRQSIAAVNRRLALTINGYDPSTGSMDLSNPDFRTYQGIKIGGGILRRASNMGQLKRAFAPVKKFLGEMGGAL